MVIRKQWMAAFPYFVVLVTAFAWRISDQRAQRRIGAAQEQVRAATAQRDSLKPVLDSLRKAATAQRETLRVAVVRRVPIIDSVTVLLRDTVPIPVEVVREVVRADSLVIQACNVVLNTCEQEKAALARDIRLLTTQRDAYKAQIPSGYQQLKSSLVAGAAGALACFILCPRR